MKILPGWSASKIEQAIEVLVLLSDESERGCVLAASAYLEETLREALCARCQQFSKISQTDLNALFKSFDSQFASFASCIRLAYALGIIDKTSEKALRDFAKMRNGFFAHKAGPTEIRAEHIKDVCKSVSPSLEAVFTELRRLANDPQVRTAANELLQKLVKQHSSSRLHLMWWAATTDVYIKHMSMFLADPASFEPPEVHQSLPDDKP